MAVKTFDYLIKSGDFFGLYGFYGYDDGVSCLLSVLVLKIDGASIWMLEATRCLLDADNGGLVAKDPRVEISRGGAFRVTTKEDSSEPYGGGYVKDLLS